MEQITELLERIAWVETRRGLWQIMLDYVHSEGALMASYHSVRPDASPLAIVADGFPGDWVHRYVQEDLLSIDPIPALAAKLARPFYWHEVDTLASLTDDHRVYLGKMREAHLGDGLAFYVFGPALQNAYVGLGFGMERLDLDPETVFEIQCAVQAGHLRYCALNERSREITPLTDREREVLEWVAKGKSNSVIAEIVGLSPHTVDAHMRKIYAKLKVNDRTTAAIRGIGSGVLQYPP